MFFHLICNCLNPKWKPCSIYSNFVQTVKLFLLCEVLFNFWLEHRKWFWECDLSLWNIINLGKGNEKVPASLGRRLATRIHEIQAKYRNVLPILITSDVYEQQRWMFEEMGEDVRQSAELLQRYISCKKRQNLRQIQSQRCRMTSWGKFTCRCGNMRYVSIKSIAWGLVRAKGKGKCRYSNKVIDWNKDTNETMAFIKLFDNFRAPTICATSVLVPRFYFVARTLKTRQLPTDHILPSSLCTIPSHLRLLSVPLSLLW